MKARLAASAAFEAVCLVDDLRARLPECAEAGQWDLFAAVWPVALRLAAIEHRYRASAKKVAKARRRIRAEAEAELSARLEGVVPVAALRRSVPLDAGQWRVVLEPGVPAELIEAA
ncbi:MAG: hypothetical protein ACYCVZ_00690 [Streptosporangiaceae bacterium]